MSTRKRIPCIAALIVLPALLAACGGVSGGTYTVNWGDWPWFWRDRPGFVVEKDFSGSVPVAGQGRIRLDAVNGQIVITGQPGAASVTVNAHVRVGSYVSRQDAENGLDRLSVRVEALQDEILVQTVQPGTSDGRRYLVDYTVAVPVDLAVEATQVNGHVTVGNIGSSLLVTVEENGSVFGTVSLPPGGEITLWTGNGNLDLRIPAATSAELSALVGLGAITWDSLVILDPVQTSRSLRGTLGGGDGRIDLYARNGTIDIAGY